MKSLVKNDKFILLVILINVGIIYLHTFTIFEKYYLIFDILDVIFTLFFTYEIVVKVKSTKSSNKLKSYLKDHWNKIDFFSVVLALPSVGVLFSHQLDFFIGFTALRSLRVFKFLRIIEYIPNGKQITSQMFKAFRSVSFIIFAFVIYSTIISLISVSLFKEYAPNYFQNAFDSFFTIFKVFSGDGFSDVVAEIELNASSEFLFFTKFYFVFIVFTGSILGLSLINSIFIDQMSDDENDKAIKDDLQRLKEQNQQLMEKIDQLNEKLDSQH